MGTLTKIKKQLLTIYLILALLICRVMPFENTQTLRGHSYSVKSIVITVGGDTIVTGSLDNKAKVVD